MFANGKVTGALAWQFLASYQVHRAKWLREKAAGAINEIQAKTDWSAIDAVKIQSDRSRRETFPSDGDRPEGGAVTSKRAAAALHANDFCGQWHAGHHRSGRWAGLLNCDRRLGGDRDGERTLSRGSDGQSQSALNRPKVARPAESEPTSLELSHSWLLLEKRKRHRATISIRPLHACANCSSSQSNARLLRRERLPLSKWPAVPSAAVNRSRVFRQRRASNMNSLARLSFSARLFKASDEPRPAVQGD